MIETSVLINTFNHAPFIASCVDSLLTQTRPPDEIIVYDDGSTDGTVEILHGYGDRIRLLAPPRIARPSHVAQANAVHSAFKVSKGRYVFLLDGDDRFKADKLERYCAAFEQHPDAVLVQAPMDKIDEHGNQLGNNLEPRKHVSNHLQEIYRQHDVDFFYPTSALAFSRYYLERALPLDVSDGLPLWTDTRLSITAPYHGRVVTLPDPFTDWRRHTKSDSIRVRSKVLQIRQTFMRARVFNAFCRLHGLPTISPWRNGRLYLQMLRYVIPIPVFSFFYDHVRPTFLRAA